MTVPPRRPRPPDPAEPEAVDHWVHVFDEFQSDSDDDLNEILKLARGDPDFLSQD